MKDILYFGTVCDIAGYDRLLSGCKNKPSVAPIVFESALLGGLAKNGCRAEVYSFPMVPTFPSCRLLYFGGQAEALACGVSCRWLRTLNLPVLKQLTRRIDAAGVLRRWGKAHPGGIVVTYSVPPFMAEDVMRYAEKYSLVTVAIIPDLPRDMYINEKNGALAGKLKQMYLRSALEAQGEYDGYIYLTDAMHSVVAPDKPYIVMEGIADTSGVTRRHAGEKSRPTAVMYAGMLHEKYGILNLVDAFSELSRENDGVELWLFGDGTAVEEIKKRSAVNKKIRYFGTVARSEILEYEKKATLLVNPRDPHEEFTKYSFPSKTTEYMLSGTPLLTTRLGGIPDEYMKYVFSADDNSVKSLLAAMRNALSHSSDELLRIGAEAQDFIVREKGPLNQGEKIKNFLSEVKKWN